MMIRSLLGWRSPAGADARLSILIFHRVHARPDPLFPGEPDAARFDAVCAWLKRWANVLPLDEAVHRWREGDLPARAAAITFDDGYADNHDVALPILQRHGLPACFFIATGFLDGGRMWNDTAVEAIRRCKQVALDLREGPLAALDLLDLGDWPARARALSQVLQTAKYLEPLARQAAVDDLAVRAGVRPPDDLMMRSEQVRALHRAGMQIGGHTVNHPILARLPLAIARAEITDGRERLQQLLDAPVTLFAYPNGKPGVDYQAEHASLVRELGFAAAVSTAQGAAHRDSDPWQLPRYTPWGRTALIYGGRLVANLHQRAETRV